MNAARAWCVGAYIAIVISAFFLFELLPEETASKFWASMMLLALTILWPNILYIYARRIGAIQGATNQLNTFDLGEVERYKARQRIRLQTFKEKVDKWT